MKNLFTLALVAAGMFITTGTIAQSNKKRVSPPAEVTQTVKNGAVVTIKYSQPSLKGRTIGTDVEPMAGKVWRTGANEATVFETSKDIKVNGMKLPAGKYALFTIFNGKEATLIFNKVWNQWGSEGYNEGQDQLRVNTKVLSGDVTEKMTFTIDETGKADLKWGDKDVVFYID
ncbi:MAG: DUF2911 domain-containing protein [Bacteroidetes bacterium]|nr:DUF2911 domain-containing protein [Bacteroidota bacterium]